MNNDTAQPKGKPVKAKTLSYHEAIGRRKGASARVRLYVTDAESVTVAENTVAKGDMFVNKRPVADYFHGEIYKRLYMEPFRTTNTIGRFATIITIVGGGLKGQLDATIMGISRALTLVDKDKFRPILKKRGFLTRDARVKERRKAGFAGKARARKQSPKR